MEINFIKTYRDPTSAASGGTPWGALIQGGAGVVQSILGGIKEHKAERDLEKLIKSYVPNQSILDFYSKSLQKYNINPYTSP